MHLFSIIPQLKLVTLEKKVFHLHVLDVTHTYILVTSSEESSNQHEALQSTAPWGRKRYHLRNFYKNPITQFNKTVSASLAEGEALAGGK